MNTGIQSIFWPHLEFKPPSPAQNLTKPRHPKPIKTHYKTLSFKPSTAKTSTSSGWRCPRMIMPKTCRHTNWKKTTEKSCLIWFSVNWKGKYYGFPVVFPSFSLGEFTTIHSIIRVWEKEVPLETAFRNIGHSSVAEILWRGWTSVTIQHSRDVHNQQHGIVDLVGIVHVFLSTRQPSTVKICQGQVGLKLFQFFNRAAAEAIGYGK